MPGHTLLSLVALLFAVAPQDAQGLLAALRQGGIAAEEMGQALDATHPLIHVR